MKSRAGGGIISPIKQELALLGQVHRIPMDFQYGPHWSCILANGVLNSTTTTIPGSRAAEPDICRFFWLTRVAMLAESPRRIPETSNLVLAVKGITFGRAFPRPFQNRMAANLSHHQDRDPTGTVLGSDLVVGPRATHLIVHR
jgi:hypothetical protein